MERLSNLIDILTESLAKVAGVAAVLIMFFQVSSVIARYVFDYSIISLQEAVIYGHALIFLLGSAFVLQKNAHVRVDLFYSKFTAIGQKWINLVALFFFILPVFLLLIAASFPYISSAWRVLEGSTHPSGIPAIFLLKSCMLVFFVSIALQACSIIWRLSSKSEPEHWATTDENR